jgi:shikimate kinase
MKNNLVFLTGFMASGKSTIGPILANTLGWDFCDLDRLIENRAGKSIKIIFKENGEKYFRELETKTLQEVLHFKNYIIALGGGTIADQINFEMIKSSGLLIYLESSPEEVYKRLKYKRDRPAFLFDGEGEPTKSEFLQRINELLESRKKYYDQANVKINTDELRVGRTVDKLASIIIKETESEINKN